MASKSARSAAPPVQVKSASAEVTDYSSEGVKNNDISTLKSKDWELCGVLTVVALFVRLFRIYQPTSVVFDEVQYVLSCFKPPMQH